MNKIEVVSHPTTIKHCFAFRFDGWGTHDCQRTEAAGVQCKPKPPPTTPPPTTTTERPKTNIHHDLEIRLFGGRDESEGSTFSPHMKFAESISGKQRDSIKSSIF